MVILISDFKFTPSYLSDSFKLVSLGHATCQADDIILSLSKSKIKKYANNHYHLAEHRIGIIYLSISIAQFKSNLKDYI